MCGDIRLVEGGRVLDLRGVAILCFGSLVHVFGMLQGISI